MAVGDAEGQELGERHGAKIESGAITAVGCQRSSHGAEVLGHVGTDLVGLHRNARTEEDVHRVAVIEVFQRTLEHVAFESSPPGVNDRERRRVFVDDEDRQTVRDQYGYRQ